jgi:hypothetical protein
MSFSDVFGTPSSEDPPERGDVYSAPAWFGPPADELGAFVPLGLVIARSDQGVVAISHAIGYTTGVGFELVAQARGLSHRDTQRLFHEQHLPRLSCEWPLVDIPFSSIDLDGEQLRKASGRASKLWSD